MTLAEMAADTTQQPMGATECERRAAALGRPDTVLMRTRSVSSSVEEVAIGGEVVGFLELAGGVWVALRGPVYSWATEVGQHIDPDVAVLALFADGMKPAPTGLPRGDGPRLFL